MLIFFVPSLTAYLHAQGKCMSAAGALPEGAGHMQEAPNMPACVYREQTFAQPPRAILSQNLTQEGCPGACPWDRCPLNPQRVPRRQRT